MKPGRPDGGGRNSEDRIDSFAAFPKRFQIDGNECRNVTFFSDLEAANDGRLKRLSRHRKKVSAACQIVAKVCDKWYRTANRPRLKVVSLQRLSVSASAGH
jgi:hypothetical protein